jgi:hypothetical protein
MSRIVPWFEREDYAAIRKLVGNDLPESFDAWLEVTKKQMAELVLRGIVYEKAVVNSKNFSAYCRASGFDQNIETLGFFAVNIARKDRESGAKAGGVSGDKGKH